MKVLVVGNGGREHALVWKINQSSHVSRLYCTLPNAGIAEVAEPVAIAPSDISGLADFVSREQIDLTVVGPELMLSDGIVDYFEERGLRIFGPGKAAAQIESSKIFAKNLMKQCNIPTAEFDVYSKVDNAIVYIREKGAPVVVKADGLAAGKGVIVAATLEDAENAARRILDDRLFGDAGSRLIVEECLKGTEATFLAFTDGKTVVPMPSSQDHKRVFNNDEGKNTGGMGAFSPSPLFTADLEKQVISDIIRPLIEGLKKEGTVFKGVIYAGLMISPENEVNVIEFNCRFGDPEAQVIIPRLKTDIIEIFNAIIDEKLDEIEIEWYGGASACVVLCSGGYPDKYVTGLPVTIKETGSMLFHAGTAIKDGTIVTNGGRVMAVTALGDTVSQALEKCYTDIDKISFEKMHYRTDIGIRA